MAILKTPIRSLLIVIVLLVTIWLPVFFQLYNVVTALFVTFGMITAGLVVRWLGLGRNKND